jgi:hypothetical protein
MALVVVMAKAQEGRVTFPLRPIPCSNSFGTCGLVEEAENLRIRTGNQFQIKRRKKFWNA